MKFFLASFILMLSACGFQPVYGTLGGQEITASTEHRLSEVEIANIGNREGQYLRNALMDRFYRYGRPLEPRYVLAITQLRERVSDLDVTRESDATRSQLLMDAELTLTDKKTGAKVLSRDLRAITSYNVLGSEFATRVTEENARQNALDDLARQIETQTSLFLRQ